jgi:hypothetical protein
MRSTLILALALALAPTSLLADATPPPAEAKPSPPAAVACETVADCWLDDSGAAIKRPKRHRGKPIPRGDCGARILWLRHKLTCEEKRCVAVHIGDKC